MGFDLEIFFDQRYIVYVDGLALILFDEIDSVFAVADRVLFLDEVERTMTALDAPQVLLDHGPPRVQEFLHRGRSA